jgi:hypothetical protein
MKLRVIHYAGALRWRWRKHGTQEQLGGYAACCSGRKAERIRAEYMHTYDRNAVTCRACLACLAKADAYQPGQA